MGNVYSIYDPWSSPWTSEDLWRDFHRSDRTLDKMIHLGDIESEKIFSEGELVTFRDRKDPAVKHIYSIMQLTPKEPTGFNVVLGYVDSFRPA